MRGRPAAELTGACHRLVFLSRVWAPLMSFRHSHHLSKNHACMPRQTNGLASGVCTFSPSRRPPSRRPPRRNASFQRLDKSFPSPRSLGREAFHLSLVRRGQASHITSVKCMEYTCMRFSLELHDAAVVSVEDQARAWHLSSSPTRPMAWRIHHVSIAWH